MADLSPIIIFAYNRTDKVYKLLQSLNGALGAENSDVFVFCDGYKGEFDKKNVEETRDIIKNYDGVFHKYTIIERTSNYGLARNIISGVSQIIDEYGKAIVLEDDLVVSKDFIQYMNDGLDYYEGDQRYGMISAYTLPLEYLETYEKDIYCIEKADCWGWATWRDRWKGVDWDLKDFDEIISDKCLIERYEKLQSGLTDMLISQHNGQSDAWAARWILHLFRYHMLTVYPKRCRAVNEGMDGSGTNCTSEQSERYGVKLNEGIEKCIFEKLPVDYRIQEYNCSYAQIANRSIRDRIFCIKCIIYDKITMLRKG